MTTIVASASGLDVMNGEARAVLDAGDVTALATRDGRDWYAVIAARAVLRGAPGRDWQPLAEADGHVLTCLLPTTGGLLAGTEDAHLLRLEGGSLRAVEAFDATPSRDEWYTPWGGPPAVRTLSEAADGTVFANVHVGGIVRSRDGGATWEPTIDIHTDVHQVLAHHPSGLLLAACGIGGLATSADGGERWQIETDGLHGEYCRAVAVSGQTVIVSASTGPSTRRGALYRRSLEGGAFQRCETGLPEWFGGNINTGWLDADDRRCVFAGPDGRLYESQDEGRSWEPIAQGLREVRAVALSPQPG